MDNPIVDFVQEIMRFHQKMMYWKEAGAIQEKENELHLFPGSVCTCDIFEGGWKKSSMAILEAFLEATRTYFGNMQIVFHLEDCFWIDDGIIPNNKLKCGEWRCANVPQINGITWILPKNK